MGGDDGVGSVAGEEDDRAPALGGHLGHERIVGLEDGGAVREHDVNDGPLDEASFSSVSMSEQPEVVAFADVGDDGDVAAIEAEAFAEDAAASGFEHGRVDGRVEQDAAGTLRAAAIAVFDAPASM